MQPLNKPSATGVTFYNPVNTTYGGSCLNVSLAVVSKSCLLSLCCSFLLKGKFNITLLLNVVILVLFFAVCCICFLFEKVVNRKY